MNNDELIEDLPNRERNVKIYVREQQTGKKMYFPPGGKMKIEEVRIREENCCISEKVKSWFDLSKNLFL